jgi:hypothetical protein
MGRFLKIRRYLLAAAVFTLGAFFFGWIISDEGPFQDFFLDHTALPNFWSALNTLPVILGVLLGRNVHQPSDFGVYLGFFIQWFVVGYLLSVLVFAYVDWGKQKKSKPD